MSNNNYVAIMAGGVGSRFWPMSRSSFPKQFLDILNTGQSLLQMTFKRFAAFVPEDHIFIVTSEDYVDIVAEQLPGLQKENIIGEPERRNTAPCIAYISFKLREMNPDANLIVAPSDHLIGDEELFRATCEQALEYTSQNNAFVTLGIKPTFANTGYGYIQYDAENGKEGVHPVMRFTEKPDPATAKVFFESGAYLWNSGIFIWKVGDILAAFNDYMPGMYQAFQSVAHNLNSPLEKQAIETVYNNCESISIDYAIMEKAENVKVIPSRFSWNDLGTWNSAWENFTKDNLSNAIKGDNALVFDSKGCLVQTKSKKLIVVSGVDDLIIVDTPDALLVCHKENEQQIKQYVASVQQTSGQQFI